MSYFITRKHPLGRGRARGFGRAQWHSTNWAHMRKVKPIKVLINSSTATVANIYQQSLLTQKLSKQITV